MRYFIWGFPFHSQFLSKPNMSEVVSGAKWGELKHRNCMLSFPSVIISGSKCRQLRGETTKCKFKDMTHKQLA